MKSVVSVLRAEKKLPCSLCNLEQEFLYHHIPFGWLCHDCWEDWFEKQTDLKPELGRYNPGDLGEEAMTI